MATLHPYITHAATLTTICLGLTGAGGGLYGLLRPAQFATNMLGVFSSTSSTSAAAAGELTTTKDNYYISTIAVRNLSGGIGLLALLWLDQRRAAGYVLLAGTVTAFADAWVCAAYPVVQQGKAVGHAVTGGIIGAVGAVLAFVE